MKRNFPSLCLRHEENIQVVAWPDPELFYFCPDRSQSNRSHFLHLGSAPIVISTEVQLGPKNTRLFWGAIEAVSHTIAVYNVDQVLGTLRRRNRDVRENVFNGVGHVGRGLVGETGRILVNRVTALAKGHVRVENIPEGH